MEDVLDVYARPYDPKRPVVCMDETNKQLLADTREPLPMQAGQPARIDHEYERQGVANLFLFFEPLAGKRQVSVTYRRTRCDWAEAMRELADVHYPDAECIVVVLDNLNTHGAASFYAAFPPEESITHPSTVAGSTWPKSNSAFWVVKPSTNASQTRPPSTLRKPPGSTNATAKPSRLTGSSPLRMPGSN